MLNQVLFWSGNKVYQLVLKDNKLYGIYLAGQFHAFTISKILLLVFTTITSFIILILIWFILPLNLRHIYNTGWDIFLFLWPDYFWYNYLIENIGFIKTTIDSEMLKKTLKYEEITNTQLKTIENKHDQEFVNINNKNFILDTKDIGDVWSSDAKFGWMWPEKHFGQMKLHLNNGKKMHFIFIWEENEALNKAKNILVTQISKV